MASTKMIREPLSPVEMLSEHRPGVRSPKAIARQSDITAALTDLRAELHRQARFSTADLTHTLQRLRRRAHASDAAIWIIAGTSAHRALHVHGALTETSGPTIELRN